MFAFWFFFLFFFFLAPRGQVLRLKFGMKGLASGVIFFFSLALRGQFLRLKFRRKGLVRGVYLKELCYFFFFLAPRG